MPDVCVRMYVWGLMVGGAARGCMDFNHIWMGLIRELDNYNLVCE